MADYEKVKEDQAAWPDDWSIDADFEALFRPADVDQSRSVLERTWYRNILYMIGEQWLAWYEGKGTFGKRYPVSPNEPTPVSNIIRDYVRTGVSLIVNKNFVSKVWPNSMAVDDKLSASLANQLLESLNADDDSDIDDVREEVAMWYYLVGNGLTRTLAQTGDRFVVNQATGKVVTPQGIVSVYSMLPFNLFTPSLGTRLRDKRCIGIRTLRNREEVEDEYEIKIPPHSDKTCADVDYQRKLLTLVAQVSPWKGSGTDPGQLEDEKSEDLVVVKEIEYKPTRRYPKGRHAVRVGDYFVFDSNLPIPTDKETGRWYYTVDHFRYNRSPGGFWCSGGVDDLISPQNNINEVDQALAKNRKSIGRPWILSPIELVLKRMSDRDDSMLVIGYDGQLSGGSKPEVRRGVPYPEQILKEREIHKTVAQEASGDPKNILRGQSPHSGASGLLVDVLAEKAEASHTPDINRFYKTWRYVDRKRLVLIQQLYTEERTIKMVAPGPGSSVYVRKYKGSDLRGNTDVRMEPASGISSTQAGTVQAVMELVKYNFFGDLSLNKPLQKDLMERLGLSDVNTYDNQHIRKADIENAILLYGSPKELATVALPEVPLQMPNSTPALGKDGDIRMLFPSSYDPSFRFDDHGIHVMVHDQLILSDEFRGLDEEKQAPIVAHRDMHMAAIKERQKAEAMAAAAAAQNEKGGRPAPGQGPGGEPMPEGGEPASPQPFTAA